METTNALDMEKAEMVDLYKEKGLSEEDATQVINIMSKYPKFFVDVMMVEELGLNPDELKASPWRQGLVMFFSFLGFGAVPLIAFIVARGVSSHSKSKAAFSASCAMTGTAMFSLGCLKAKLTASGTGVMRVLSGGLTMLCTGGISAGTAYAIGALLQFLIKGDSNKT
eukprot:c11595_g1_i1.p1 GENE.c11595_g1_i1~~c11595_g1_i1.p1  ORF type:complete len:168 (-),score=29.57 c11595_g1_i1:31-534(-)